MDTDKLNEERIPRQSAAEFLQSGNRFEHPLVRGLPLLQYYGEHRDLIEFPFGFQARQIANDYSGAYELFYQQVVVLEKLHGALVKDIKFEVLWVSIAEKTTQLVLQGDEILQGMKDAEAQLNKVSGTRFTMSHHYHVFVNRLEGFLWKQSSIFDLLARAASHIYSITGISGVPNKYGQQKNFEKLSKTFRPSFDPTYQRLLLRNRVMNLCHEYRHRFSHEASMKMMPVRRNERWFLVICEGMRTQPQVRGITIGLKPDLMIKLSLAELKRFLSDFDGYFVDWLQQHAGNHDLPNAPESVGQE